MSNIGLHNNYIAVYKDLHLNRKNGCTYVVVRQLFFKLQGRLRVRPGAEASSLVRGSFRAVTLQDPHRASDIAASLNPPMRCYSSLFEFQAAHIGYGKT